VNDHLAFEIAERIPVDHLDGVAEPLHDFSQSLIMERSWNLTLERVWILREA
jgi:hypothetical protein